MKASNPKRRRGAFLAEAAVAGLLLAVALAMTVRFLGWIASERRSAERRGWAIQEAANAMETLAAIPFDRLNEESARAASRLSPHAEKILPEGKAKVEIRDAEGMKRVDLTIRWRGPSGHPEAPVRITTWLARKGGGT